MPLFHLGTPVETGDLNLSVALSDGRILVAGNNGPGVGVFSIQYHAADGTALGPIAEIGHDGMPGAPFTASLLALPGGGALALAQSASGSAIGLQPDEVFIRSIGANGSAAPSFRQVNAVSDDFQANAYGAVAPDGSFAVAFTDASLKDQVYEPLLAGVTVGPNRDSRASDPLIARFDTGGDLSFGPAVAFDDSGPHNPRAGAQISGQPAILDGGAVVVPYYDVKYGVGPDGRLASAGSVSISIDGVEKSVFNPEVPAPAGADFIWASEDPMAVALPGGGFAVTWLMRERDGGVILETTKIRYFDSAGSALTDPIDIIQRGQNAAGDIGLAALSDGSIAAVYDLAAPGEFNNVHVNLIAPMGTSLSDIQVAGGAGNQRWQSVSVTPNDDVIVSYLDGAAGRVQTLVAADSAAAVGSGSAADDRYGGTDGGDVFSGGAGDDLAILGAGGDRAMGGAGSDRLLGEAGDDTLMGGDGADTLNGGDGDDLIRGGTTEADLRDVIYAGAGNDSVDGGHGNDQIYGQGGNDTLAGGFGADTLEGQDGDDVITGSALGDIVFGNAGDDFVNGGFGHDLINGGSGADKFFHAGGDADAILGHGSDWVQDYDAAEGDVLVFGGAASAADFQVNFTHTANRETGERSGEDDVQEAFVIYRPTGQILWALVDGGGQGSINLQIGADVFDLLA